MSEELNMAVIIDPVQSLNPKKDTSIALMAKAEERGWSVEILETKDLFLKYGQVWAKTQAITIQQKNKIKEKESEKTQDRKFSIWNKNKNRVREVEEQEYTEEYTNEKHIQEKHINTKWYETFESQEKPLDQFDIILMRKDPPVDLNYIYATYLLEHAELAGSLVANQPQALRDANEKLYTNWFPQCMPGTIVTADMAKLRAFIEEQEIAILKPLSGMGGKGIFKCEAGDPNIPVIVETLSNFGNQYVVAQKYIPEITEGDKRIIMIDGEPIPYALARIPKAGDFRGNLASGARAEAVKLSKRDYWICEQVGETLKEKGLYFVGLDVIGDYLTEMNVTSPTCVVELEAETGIDITGRILDCLVSKIEN